MIEEILAFHLPQFHKDKFNDEWWGEDFTEWENVKKARPLFKGHDQPRIPSRYYNLNDDHEIISQHDLARRFGITGFIYYAYWYQGLTPLSAPLERLLSISTPSVRYALCWANHSWTRSWKNRAGALDVLIEQSYPTSDEDFQAFCAYWQRHFTRDNYIKVDGKPLFVVYQIPSIPEWEKFLQRFRNEMRSRYALDVYIVACILTSTRDLWDSAMVDNICLMQPSLAQWSNKQPLRQGIAEVELNIGGLIRKLPLKVRRILYVIQDLMPSAITFRDYNELWRKALVQYAFAIKVKRNAIPVAFVDFDNTARYRNRAYIFKGFSAQSFQEHLFNLISLVPPKGSQFLFINAWNEWGEGMYLETDATWGESKLVAVKSAINRAVASTRTNKTDERVVSHEP